MKHLGCSALSHSTRIGNWPRSPGISPNERRNGARADCFKLRPTGNNPSPLSSHALRAPAASVHGARTLRVAEQLGDNPLQLVQGFTDSTDSQSGEG